MNSLHLRKQGREPLCPSLVEHHAGACKVEVGVPPGAPLRRRGAQISWPRAIARIVNHTRRNCLSVAAEGRAASFSTGPGN